MTHRGRGLEGRRADGGPTQAWLAGECDRLGAIPAGDVRYRVAQDLRRAMRELERRPPGRVVTP